MRCFGLVLITLAGLSLPTLAQVQPQQPAQAQQPAPNTWEKMPRMQLERQFAGPLQDTIIQRWRDPGDGTVCYVYLPITAQHTPPTTSGFVQYGPNQIGSISCFETAAPPRPNAARTPAPRPN